MNEFEIITEDALLCQRSIVKKITDGGGDYVFPAKGNQKFLREEIETAFHAPVFPIRLWDSGPKKAHGRIEQRIIGGDWQGNTAGLAIHSPDMPPA